jgi:hypothetical protein
MPTPNEGEIAPLVQAPKKSRKKTKTVLSIVEADTKEQAPKKRVSRKKPVTAKKLANHLSITEVPENTRKLTIIENITKKKTGVTKTAKTPQSFAMTSSRLSMILLTPFRVQFDHSQFVSGMARYAGTAFVVVGAFLTVYNMNAFGTFMKSEADTRSATVITACVPGTYCPRDSEVSGVANEATKVTPEADIALEVSGPVLTERIPVSVTVHGALRVDLVAYLVTTAEERTIGTLSQVSDGIWKTEWETSLFDDGTYRLRAVIKNEHGNYTVHTPTEYEILNHPLEVAETVSDDLLTASGTSTEEISDGDEDEEKSLSNLSVEVGNAEFQSGTVPIVSSVEGASLVRHYIRSSDADMWTLLGNAALDEAGTWKYSFDTTPFLDGEYSIRTLAYQSDIDDALRSTVDLIIRNEGKDLSTAPSEDDSEEILLAPEARIEVTNENPQRGTVGIFTHVEGATQVALYLLPERSLMPRFVGLAQMQSSGVWRYTFDTTSVPNGTYALYANVRHLYGESKTTPTPFTVSNTMSVAIPDDIQAYFTSLKETGDASRNLLALGIQALTEEDDASTTEPTRAPSYLDIIEQDFGDEYSDELESHFTTYHKALISILGDYGKTVRADDEGAQRAALIELENVREEYMKSIPLDAEDTELLTKAQSHIETMTSTLRERTEESESLIKERVGDTVAQDSDSDGITDYDEINIYTTSPLLADTDSDGFIDGAEVQGGYNPNDSTREVNTMYESPLDHGVLRDDILTISGITTLTEGDVRPKAYISGTALPNSFITLYIFSTPHIITVKADARGDWGYVFDGELDQGEHTAYIGMTDNTGSLIAKSSPLAFAKTDEAYIPIEAPKASVISLSDAAPLVMSERALLVIGSIAVVALGLVLLLLGIHVRPQKKGLAGA